MDKAREFIRTQGGRLKQSLRSLEMAARRDAARGLLDGGREVVGAQIKAGEFLVLNEQSRSAGAKCWALEFQFASVTRTADNKAVLHADVWKMGGMEVKVFFGSPYWGVFSAAIDKGYPKRNWAMGVALSGGATPRIYRASGWTMDGSSLRLCLDLFNRADDADAECCMADLDRIERGTLDVTVVAQLDLSTPKWNKRNADRRYT